jgi:glycosyltransferase involved in cell wall biosynthesis
MDRRGCRARVEGAECSMTQGEHSSAGTGIWPMAEPFVSCIMPTCDRRTFVPLAITYFLRQDYANSELIVVDNGSDAVADLIPGDARIRYLRLLRKPLLGTIRNIACDEARGDLIMHWDDDDWMAHWRIRYQVDGLLQSGADICGVSRLCYLDMRTLSAWQYIYPEGRRPYVCDNTICFSKDFWSRHPFPDEQENAGLAFLWSDMPKQIVALEDDSFYIGLLHAANSAPKDVTGPRWYPYPVEDIQARMGDDWDYYHRMCQN